MHSIDPDICRRARLSRDARFDGEFFLAVSTTGIYCRPICPARPPREDNVRYFRTAAEASQQGYRPCLRCRPESAPQSPAWLGTSTTVARAMDLINAGYLNDHGLADLANRLGIGERYLRKLFRDKVGASPSEIAHTQRLHFAQKLLLETTMGITDIAFASGFGSVRRFNSALRDKFGCTPGELRQRRGGRASRTSAGHTSAGRNPPLQLELNYRPPYDWDGVLHFFARHAIAGIESVADGCYQRSIEIDGHAASVAVRHHPRRPALLVTLQLPDTRQLVAVVARVRRMFDLDAAPASIAETLDSEPGLATLLQRYPGIRSPVQWTDFEAMVRAIVGQQVSIAAARNVFGRLTDACAHRGTAGDAGALLFPGPAQLLALPDEALPMPDSRKRTLRTFCEHTLSGDTAIAVLQELPGIGPWTLAMAAMRGTGDPDVFPATDLGLVKAASAAGCDITGPHKARTQAWSPWRSYAANLLWRSLS